MDKLQRMYIECQKEVIAKNQGFMITSLEFHFFKNT